MSQAVDLQPEPEPVIAEILSLGRALRPRAFFGRIDYWRRGGLSSGAGSDFVKGTRGSPMPELDRLDRELQQASRQFRDDIEDARRLLAHANALQQKYLFSIEIASPDLLDVQDQDSMCRRCKKTKTMWLREKWKSPWRLKGGVGPCCYSEWLRDGKPDLPPIDAKHMNEATA